ncbi:hypothetical protein GCM10022221_21840 [Actinocorallia aurea]
MLDMSGPEEKRKKITSVRLVRALGLSLGFLYALPQVHQIAGLGGARGLLAGVVFVLFTLLYFGLGLYRDAWQRARPVPRWALYGSFVALCAAAPFVFGPGMDGTPVYAGVISALLLSGRPAIVAVCLAAAGAAAVAVRDGDDTDTVLIFGGTTFGLGMLLLNYRRSRELVGQLRAARAEVAVLAAAEERLRIARDLHDLLGHSLSLIVLKSELAGRLAERDPAAAVREIRDVNAVARESLRDVRETVTGYRRRSLAEELDSARGVLAAAGVEPVLRTSGTPLPEPVDALFAWAVRECVTNVVRHARATRCEITVAAARLEVADDGKAKAPVMPGNGLEGLRERAAELDGTVQTSVRRPSGLVVRVAL